MSRLSPFIGGTRRLVLHAGQYGLLLGPVRRALIEPAAAANDEILRLLVCYCVGRNLPDAYERMEFGELTAKAGLLGSGDSQCG